MNIFPIGNSNFVEFAVVDDAEFGPKLAFLPDSA
jgi:hypothetical protein